MATTTTTTTSGFRHSAAIPLEDTYDPSTLANKTVIITGGTSGVGEACLRAFISHGAFVTFSGRSEPRGTSLAHELNQNHAIPRAIFVQGDATSWSSQLHLFQTALSHSPSKSIDIVLANAGISGADDVFHNDAEDGRDEPVEPKLNIIDINLKAVLYSVKLANFYFARQDKGADKVLIMTASIAGYADQPGTPQYNASKFGVRGIMRSLRRTAPAIGMRVNVVAPWYIRARIMSDEVQAKLESKGVKFAELDDAAAAVLHLACGTSYNGRAVAIVPRESLARGYFDLQQDDADDDEILGPWQELAVKASARVGTT